MAGGGHRYRRKGGGARVSSASMGAGSGQRFDQARRDVGDAARQMQAASVAWWVLVPVPFLALSLVFKAIGLQWVPLAATVAMLFLVFEGWFFVRKGLRAGAEDEGRKITTGRFPWRILGAGSLGLAAGIGGYMIAGPEGGFLGQVGQAVIAGVAIFASVLLAVGFDQVAARGLAQAAKEAGMDKNMLVAAFKEARGKIATLRQAAQRTLDKGLSEHLMDIAAVADRVVAQIEEQPRDLRRARRFLATYLDSATKIAQDFQRNQDKLSDSEIESKYAGLLEQIETTFLEQEAKLNKDDHLDLDVRIEVLKTQMQREGL